MVILNFRTAEPFHLNVLVVFRVVASVMFENQPSSTIGNKLPTEAAL
jgi:hypothetical protein